MGGLPVVWFRFESKRERKSLHGVLKVEKNVPIENSTVETATTDSQAKYVTEADSNRTQ